MKILTCLTAVLPFLFGTGDAIAGEGRVVKLSIERMFELADENNSSIRGYSYAESAAAEAVRSARNDRLPSLDLSASASLLGNGILTERDFTGAAKAPIPRFGNNFALEAAQVIYAGGAVSSNIAMAELKLRSLQSEAEINRQNVRFLLAGSYLELYKLDNRAEVYRKNIDQTRRLLADIRLRYDEGLAISNDITRYELQLQRLELALTQTENSRTIVNDRMVTTLGLDDGVRIEPDRTVVEQLPQMLSESAWQQSAEESPVLRQARLGVEQSKQGVKLARAQRIPSLSLFAGDKLDGPILIEVPPINKNLNYWYVGAALRFNIASLYKSGKDIRRAKYLSQQAQAAEETVRENLQSEVREAWIRLDEACTVCEMQEKNLELAARNHEVVRTRFLNDSALITDMLDADSEKLAAELDLVNARIGILFAVYRLRHAAGDL